MRILLWISYALIASGILMVVSNLVALFMGMSTAYNFGDATKYEFILVPFWQLGLGAMIPGIILRYLSTRSLQSSQHR